MVWDLALLLFYHSRKFPLALPRLFFGVPNLDTTFLGGLLYTTLYTSVETLYGDEILKHKNVFFKVWLLVQQ